MDRKTKLIERARVASEYPPLTPRCLSNLAHRGKGPGYIMIGRKAYYRPEEIEKWLADNTVRPTLKKRSVKPAGRPKKVRTKGGKD